MRNALLSCLIPLVLVNPASAADQNPEHTQVYFGHHELNYIGSLDKEANKKLFALYDSLPEKPTTLMIRSQGGEINTGMEIGNWIRDHHLDVKVLEYCISSCANYVFTAGAHKVVSNFALIGYHGGASSMEFKFDDKMQAMLDAMPPEKRDAFMAGFKANITADAAKEAVFFQSIGVRQELTRLGQQDKYKSLMERSPDTQVWTYSLEGFARFGVGAITVINPPWKPVSPSKSFGFETLPLD